LDPTSTRVSGDHPAGMILRGSGLIAEGAGPFVVSGGWWRREVVRHYWYVRVMRTLVDRDRTSADAGPGAESGPLPDIWFWIYRDARRLRWFLHGVVE
jgi:hypothetical protein